MSNQAKEQNERLIKLINSTTVDTDYLYDSDRLLDEKMQLLAMNCGKVLDFGKSSRVRFNLFKEDQVVTVDINEHADYPDVIDDICDVRCLEWESIDGIVCLSVLEHVYAPHRAVENLYRLLRKDGYCLVHVPFLWRYHASPDLQQQDYFRFTRDGLAYLFKDFSEVTIYPVRGPYSTIFNLFRMWKGRIEKTFGQGVNKFVDKIFCFVSRNNDLVLQASGYFLWAKK